MKSNYKPRNNINFVKMLTAIEIALLDITSACMYQKSIYGRYRLMTVRHGIDFLVG